MGLFSPFVYTAKNGKKFWLHVREKGKQKLYYFSKDPTGALRDLPKGYEVVENPVTGMPFLKRKEAKGLFSGLRPKKQEEQQA